MVVKVTRAWRRKVTMDKRRKPGRRMNWGCETEVMECSDPKMMSG